MGPIRYHRFTSKKDKRVYLKSVLLPNGNLVIPKLLRRKPYVAAWVEIEPGTSDYKRWIGVHEVGPDPRTLDGYLRQLRNAVDNELDYTLTGVFKEQK